MIWKVRGVEARKTGEDEYEFDAPAEAQIFDFVPELESTEMAEGEEEKTVQIIPPMAFFAYRAGVVIKLTGGAQGAPTLGD